MPVLSVCLSLTWTLNLQSAEGAAVVVMMQQSLARERDLSSPPTGVDTAEYLGAFIAMFPLLLCKCEN